MQKCVLLPIDEYSTALAELQALKGAISQFSPSYYLNECCRHISRLEDCLTNE